MLCIIKAQLADLYSEQTLVQALKTAKVTYIVAPYEADAQMAFLALNGHVHAVITEDSDLLAYGCPRVRPPDDSKSVSSWQVIWHAGCSRIGAVVSSRCCINWTEVGRGSKFAAKILARTRAFLL